MKIIGALGVLAVQAPAQASTTLQSDLDGDGKAERLVLDAKREKTLEVWRGKVRLWQGVPRRWKPWKLMTAPKWLGSSLSKPFVDFALTRLDNDKAAELVAIEVRRDGKRGVVAYSWNSFGFAVAWQRGAWKTVSLVVVAPRGVVVKADGQQIVLR